jgi:hypothetical protein
MGRGGLVRGGKNPVRGGRKERDWWCRRRRRRRRRKRWRVVMWYREEDVIENVRWLVLTWW